MSDCILRDLGHAELREAARLVGSAMSQNPINIRAFDIRDRERLSRAQTRFFAPVLRGLFRRGLLMGAFRDGTLVGTCGMAPPSRCQPSVLEKLTVVPSVVLGNPLGTTLRVLRWTGEWARRDPTERHWHLGPVAVDSCLQRQGIGSAMLAAFCARMDSCAEFSYLETDKPENVVFYQKFGFLVAAEAEVLGVPNWFMTRRPTAN
jgi:ribosomal protein S18 acetylase RimI-like enzyme